MKVCIVQLSGNPVEMIVDPRWSGEQFKQNVEKLVQRDLVHSRGTRGQISLVLGGDFLGPTLTLAESGVHEDAIITAVTTKAQPLCVLTSSGFGDNSTKLWN